MGRLKRFVWMLTRRKPMDVSEEAPTDLNRCLNTLDLTAMGVGATLGFGLYVLSGEVAAQKAGPGVVLSFMIAAIASTFSALCYAEFAAKVPKSGSAYAYSYITVGEFVAFVIGWNLTLEHVIGTASLARGYSGYLGSLFGDPEVAKQMAAASSTLNSTSLVVNALETSPGWLPDYLQGYVAHFDWLAFFLTMLVTGLLLLGVEVSSRFQICFATINLAVACFIFACGLFKADLHNWQLTPAEIPANAGTGGFLPFGWTGVIAGAGTCFFAFVGFDGIAATAEEVKNPRKAIPRSILWTSGIIFITYCCMATIQTLIWPYWDQKQAAPLPYIFEKLGMHFAKWTILVGVLAGLSTSFVGGFLPLPRILYAMARDGVIYRVLSIVSKRFRVPVVATIAGGLLIACLASMLEIDQLADMLSIGTLAAYSLVSISVLLLRYEYREPARCENPLPVSCQEAREMAEAARDGARKCTNLDLTTNGPLSLTTLDKEKININGGQLAIKKTNNEQTNGLAAKLDHDLNGIKEVKKNININNNNNRRPSTSSRTSGSSSTTSSSGRATTSSLEETSTNQTTSDSNCSISRSSAPSRRPLISLFVEGTRDVNNQLRLPDAQTTHISRVMILILTIVTTLLDYTLVIYGPTLYLMEPLPVTICSGMFLLTIILGLLLNRLPTAISSTNSFEVPLVPLIPLFSVIINTYLMLNLSVMTWIRFAVWMTIGFFIYFTYGIFRSTGYKDSRCD